MYTLNYAMFFFRGDLTVKPVAAPMLNMVVCQTDIMESKMYAVTVTFNLKTAWREVFLPLVIDNAHLSLEEPACRKFDVCLDPDRPNTVFLYELYDDVQAFKAHLRTPHFKKFSEKTEGMIEHKDIHCFSEVIL